MTTRFWHQPADVAVEITAVRLSPEHRGGGLPTDFRVGQSASGGVMVDDPGGTLDFQPWRRFWVTDDEAPAGNQRVWTGYITEVRISRGDHFTGAGRVWNLTLLDINSIIHHRIIRATDGGNRPAESDITRLGWWLGTAWASGVIFTDLGLVDSSWPVALDAHDYTGRYFGEALADLSNASGKNHALVHHEASDHRDVFYANNDSGLWASTLQISNVAADIDNVTTFAPSDPSAPADAELARDPSRVYAGIWLPFTGGSVYRTRPATAGEVWRDGIAPAAEVKTLAKANALADRELDEIADPDENITTPLWLPKDKITLIKPGHRVQVKFSHLPGYGAAFRGARIINHVIRQDVPDQADDWYRLDLELSPQAVCLAIQCPCSFSPLAFPDGRPNRLALGYPSTTDVLEAFSDVQLHIPAPWLTTDTWNDGAAGYMDYTGGCDSIYGIATADGNPRSGNLWNQNGGAIHFKIEFPSAQTSYNVQYGGSTPFTFIAPAFPTPPRANVIEIGDSTSGSAPTSLTLVVDGLAIVSGLAADFTSQLRTNPCAAGTDVVTCDVTRFTLPVVASGRIWDFTLPGAGRVVSIAGYLDPDDGTCSR